MVVPPASLSPARNGLALGKRYKVGLRKFKPFKALLFAEHDCKMNAGIKQASGCCASKLCKNTERET
jgi:hypothetical protein